MDRLPRWADVALVPLVSLILAFAIAALVILAIGQDPWEAITVMVQGSVMNAYGWGYTLYYATSFMFTGLAVCVAFHASGSSWPPSRVARASASNAVCRHCAPCRAICGATRRWRWPSCCTSWTRSGAAPCRRAPTWC